MTKDQKEILDEVLRLSREVEALKQRLNRQDEERAQAALVCPRCRGQWVKHEDAEVGAYYLCPCGLGKGAP